MSDEDRAISKHKPAAFIVEPLLGEGGAELAPPGYLQGAKEVDLLVDSLGAILDAYPDPVRVLRDATVRVAEQWRAKGAFR